MSPMQSSRASKVVAAAVLSLFMFWLLQIYPQRSLSPSKNPQYFRDVVFRSDSKQIGANNHCDSRYVKATQLTRDETMASLEGLLINLSKFMGDYGLEFWIAHGTLLGWYWNGQLLPWDMDVDVQVSESTLMTLAREFNGSTYPEPPNLPQPGYTLDVNPFWEDLSPEDTANKIDARWIDRANGKYIDITAVRPESSVGHTSLRSKDGHRYRVGQNLHRPWYALTLKCSDIFPLLRTSIETVEILVPKKHEAILRKEYGEHALSMRHFHWYFRIASRFND